MQTSCYNGQGGFLQIPSVISSPIPFVPWWTVIGSARNYGELQLKPSYVDHPNGKDPSSAAFEEANHAMAQDTGITFQEKGNFNLAKISISPSNFISFLLRWSLCFVTL